MLMYRRVYFIVAYVERYPITFHPIQTPIKVSGLTQTS